MVDEPAYLIRAEGYVAGYPCEFAGQWLEWYDPNIPDPRLDTARFTDDPAKAKRFPSGAHALAEWQRVREIDPVRPDGKPNRPLTALTVSIERAPE